VSIVLLQHTTDSRDVLDGELEHNQLHRSLANHIEVLQETVPRTQMHTLLNVISSICTPTSVSIHLILLTLTKLKDNAIVSAFMDLEPVLKLVVVGTGICSF